MPVDLASGFVSVTVAIMLKKRFLRLVKIVTGSHPGMEEEFNRLERFTHFWLLVGRSFVRNRCPVRAAALSYTTLLALIPLLAVAIGVTSSLLKTQGENEIYAGIDKLISYIMPPATAKTDSHGALLSLSPISITLTPTNSIVAEAPTNSIPDTNTIAGATENPGGETPIVSVSAQREAAKSIHEFVQNTQSGTLGVVGMLLLVFVAISMFSRIESTFNDIWGVTRGRNWLVRILLYWTIPTLGTLLVTAALLLASGPHFQTTKNFLVQMPLIGDFIFEFLPLVVLWLTFALVYLLVPNTKVRFGAAFIGGMVGGSLWHLNNVFGFLYVSRVVTNSKIYGSLGLVPVFMVGLYFSWLILLFGAQVAYAWQNRQSYLQDKLVENVNQRGREFIALRLMTLIGGRFQHGEPAATLQQISAALGIPTKLVQQILQPLLAARLISEIAGGEPAYLPARPLDAINAHHVLRAIRVGSGQDIATRDEPARAEVLGEFAKIEDAERAAASSLTMLALVNRAQKQIGDAAPKSKS
jgi:membrane protein